MMHRCNPNQSETTVLGNGRSQYRIVCPVCGRRTIASSRYAKIRNDWKEMLKKYPIYYSIAKEYTETPGHRTGPFSGEEFRSILRGMILDVRSREGEGKVLIDTDGTYGYPIGFIEEVFGGYVREYKESPEDLIAFAGDEEASAQIRNAASSFMNYSLHYISE